MGKASAVTRIYGKKLQRPKNIYEPNKFLIIKIQFVFQTTFSTFMNDNIFSHIQSICRYAC